VVADVSRDTWKDVRDGFDRWIKLSCYLGFVWIFIDILPYLPQHLVDRIVDGLLAKVGL
jgi:hypothetical protein